jgi:zinc transport system ATP-binding protein
MIAMIDATHSRQPILDVQDLSITLGNYLAVDSVSFQLEAGTNTSIVGANGAGKSTLIQGILGLLPLTSGQVHILGQPISKLRKQWRSVSYIPQRFGFDRYFPLSVAELVGLAFGDRPVRLWFDRKLRYQRRTAIYHALAQVELHHKAKQSLGSLSGGELKRALLAYCLVVPRQLLILDEAMAGVDVRGEAEFAELLAILQKEQGWTVLQVSHDLDMVSRYSDRVICLNKSIHCQGAPDQTLSPQNLQAIYGSGFAHYTHHCH